MSWSKNWPHCIDMCVNPLDPIREPVCLCAPFDTSLGETFTWSEKKWSEKHVREKTGPENKGSGITMVIEKKLVSEKNGHRIKWPEKTWSEKKMVREKKWSGKKRDVDLTGSALLVGVRAVSHSSHSDGCCSPVLLILAPQIVAFACKQSNDH